SVISGRSPPLRSAQPSRLGWWTAWPAARRPAATRCHAQPPVIAPWIRTKVAIGVFSYVGVVGSGGEGARPFAAAPDHTNQHPARRTRPGSFAAELGDGGFHALLLDELTDLGEGGGEVAHGDPLRALEEGGPEAAQLGDTVIGELFDAQELGVDAGDLAGH